MLQTWSWYRVWLDKVERVGPQREEPERVFCGVNLSGGTYAGIFGGFVAGGGMRFGLREV